MLSTIWHHLTAEAGAMNLEQLRARLETPESRYIELQGMQVHYRDAGDPQAPVLILLHGIFSSLHTWNGWTELLRRDFRVISIDAPNFGLTGPHPRGMFRHLYSDFLNDFTNALGIRRCSVAGNSLGGWMSWEFAARFPHKVDKLMLLDSAGFFFVPPLPLVSMAMPLGGWMASRVVPPRRAFYALIRSAYGRPQRLSQDTMERYYQLWLRPGNRRAGARVLRFVRNHGGFNAQLLAAVTQPVLIMWGRDDQWIPPAHAGYFARSLPQAETIMYDDCGHMPMEELAQQSAAAALTFLHASRTD